MAVQKRFAFRPKLRIREASENAGFYRLPVAPIRRKPDPLQDFGVLFQSDLPSTCVSNLLMRSYNDLISTISNSHKSRAG